MAGHCIECKGSAIAACAACAGTGKQGEGKLAKALASDPDAKPFALVCPRTDNLEWFDTIAEAMHRARTYGMDEGDIPDPRAETEYGPIYVLQLRAIVPDPK